MRPSRWKTALRWCTKRWGCLDDRDLRKYIAFFYWLFCKFRGTTEKKLLETGYYKNAGYYKQWLLQIMLNVAKNSLQINFMMSSLRQIKSIIIFGCFQWDFDKLTEKTRNEWHKAWSSYPTTGQWSEKTNVITTDGLRITGHDQFAAKNVNESQGLISSFWPARNDTLRY